MNAPEPNRPKSGPKPKDPLRPKDIEGLKYFKIVRDLLEPLHKHCDVPNRKLHYDDLAALVLLYFLNPVITSLRGLQQASALKNVKRKLGIRRTSLGSLSESSHVFDADLLGQVFQELVGQAEALDGLPRPAGLAEELAITACDGSLMKGLPRAVWALWLDEGHKAAKLHLEYDVLKGIPKTATVTDGNGNEKEVFRKRLEPGKLYVLDAGYAQYSLLEAIVQQNSSFVVRLRDNAVYEMLEARALTDEDRQAGVVFDRIVRLGNAQKQKDLSRPVRVIKVHVKNPPSRGRGKRCAKVSSKKTFRHQPEEYDLLLVTDLLDCPAETIALLYRYRWTVELFFRWFKCVLRFGHWLFESENGVKILVYCALIVSLLITVWTGRKPTKRTLEMIQFYFQGWAELDELEEHFGSLQKKAI
jgi:hypothetical protein